jgi:hypothetical protein
VAEVSLLGALGCGRQLLQLLIEELETGDKYDYLVLQATDNAIGFYEKMGFTRVGAVSRPDEEAVAAQMAEAQRQREAKALLRERQRQHKLADKDTVKGERERLLVEAAKQQAGGWREACREVLQRLLQSPDANKLPWPKVLPDNQVAKNLVSARAALDETSKAQTKNQPKYSDTEHFVRDIKRLLQLTMAPHTIGEHVYDACARLLQLFNAEWRQLGEHAAAVDSKRYFIYVDILWEQKQHFRLFELHGTVEQKSASKAYAQAREYRVATEAESPGPFDTQRLRMLPRTPKPQKLLWTARRDLHGMVQSECICVKVSPADAVTESDDAGVLVVEEQARMVALAYVRLHALRALQQDADAAPDDAPAAATQGHQAQHEIVDAPGAAAPDISGMGEESDMSEYELARLRRMQENARLLESTGIMSIAKHVDSLVSHDSKETGSPAKKKRCRASAASEEGEVSVRSLRSKVLHEGAPIKAESEDKSSLSDVDTPLKYEGAPAPAATYAGQKAKQKEHASPKRVKESAQAEAHAAAGEEEAKREGGSKQADKVAVAVPTDKDSVPVPVAERPFPADACYVAKEDETPRMIAKMFGLDLQCLVKLNKGQYPTLTANSRLRKSTQLRLPNPGDRDVFIPASKLDEKGEGWYAYCHWTFPDQKVEDMTASYMMVRRLQRREADSLPPDSMLKVLDARKVKVPPRTKSAVELLEEAALPAGVHRAEGWPDKHQTEYSCQEDDRPAAIAKKLGVDADQLVALNRILYPTLNKTVPLKAGTLLRLPPPLSVSGRAERPQWWQPSLDIVVKLKKMRQADPFLTPVDWEEMGLVEYPFIISQPMDLGTVEEKLLCNSYVSAAQVERDVRLIFDNARHFNQPEDAVHQMAGKLLKLFSCLWVQANLDSCSVAKVSVYMISLFSLCILLSIYGWMYFSLSLYTQRES